MKDIERENKEMKERRERGRAEMNQVRNDGDSKNKKQREFEQAIAEMNRKSNLNAQELE